MSSAGPQKDEAVKELITKILQFLKHQIENSNVLDEAAKESLSVAHECIEQTYNINSMPASEELLNMYLGSKTTQTQQRPAQETPPLDMNQIFSLINSFNPNMRANTNPSSSQSTPAAQETRNEDADLAILFKIQPKPTPTYVSEDNKSKAELNKNKGNDLMKENNPQEAVTAYTMAIELDPNNAIYYSNRAAALTKLEKYQEAFEDCRIALSLDPKYAKAYSRLALNYALQGQHGYAAKAYKKAVELEPSNMIYRDNLAIEEAAAKNEAPAGETPRNAQPQGQPSFDNMFQSLFGGQGENPDVLGMAMRALQDPRLRGVMASITPLLTGQQAQPPPPGPPSS